MAYRAIVIAGPMGAGKDYVAERFSHVLTRSGVPAPIIRVGDYFYDIVAHRHGVTADEVLARKPEFRDELQHVGADSLAQANAIALARVRLERSSGVPVVIARKPAEVAAMRRLGAYAVAVDAPLHDRLNRVAQRDRRFPTTAQLAHPVESPASDLPVDALINNDAAAGELHVRYERAAEQMDFHNAHGTFSTRGLACPAAPAMFDVMSCLRRDAAAPAEHNGLLLQSENGRLSGRRAATSASILSLEQRRFEKGRAALLDSLYRSGLLGKI